MRCTVFVPDGNNPEKNAAMRAFGATVQEGGRDFDEARERCEQAAASTGARYVHSANEPLLIAGVGTYGLEIFEALPEVDTILVPIGGGSGACGNCLVRTGLGSKARVIGVQAEKADAFARSWRGKTRVVGTSADTFAEGMATRVTFDLTFEILQRELDDIVTVSEEELAEGVRLALRATHNLAEGAGAASLAAAVKLREPARRPARRRGDVGWESRRRQVAVGAGLSVGGRTRSFQTRRRTSAPSPFPCWCSVVTDGSSPPASVRRVP